MAEGAGTRSVVNLGDVFRFGGGFPPDAVIPVDIYESMLLPASAEREDVLDAMMLEYAKRASELDALSEELRELIARHDPAQLILLVALRAGLCIADPRANDDAPRTFSWDAKIEYLTGLALAGPPGRRDVDLEVATTAARLVSSVFDAAHAQFFTQWRSERRTERSGVDQTSYLLRLENLTVRMAGYRAHLEEISDEVFERHRALYREELGFCPSDAIRLVHRHRDQAVAELNTAHDALNKARTSERPADEVAIFEARLHTAMQAVYVWDAEDLAQGANIPVGEVTALLHSMSVEFGCQPEFSVPSDGNQIRRYPLVRLPGGAYLAPVPDAIPHIVHEWLQGYIQNNPAPRLARSYPRHRSDAAERLVHRSLEEVFGEPAVFGNQHYDSTEGHGEIDCLVVGSTPIVAEVKSQSLTDLGRRGHRPRVVSVADTVVIKSFEQSRRARAYILHEGGRYFADRQGRSPRGLLPSGVTDVIGITVTLERMDPLSTAAGELAADQQNTRAWITSLADFLMVRGILDNPASFLHYARTRRTIGQLGIQVYAEADALGAYLIDRLATLINQAAESADEELPVHLPYSGTAINQFFTTQHNSTDLRKPDTGVPSVILKALGTCATGYPRDWVTIAYAVMDTLPRTWRAWRHFVRKHTGERPFLLPGRKASIIVSPALGQAELRVGTTPSLAVPRQAVLG